MIDWRRVRGFEWDQGNARKSVDKHDVGQWEAEEVFFHMPLVVSADTAHSASEARFHALGRTGHGRLLHPTFTLRDDGRLIRVVSARPMSRQERTIYEQAQAGT